MLRLGTLLASGLAVLTLVTVGATEYQGADDGTMEVFEVEETNGATARGQVLWNAERDAFLKAINDARQAVNLDPLVWSEDLSRFSLRWIKESHDNKYWPTVLAGNIPTLEHRPRAPGKFQQKYGENAYMSWCTPADATATSASDAVPDWLNEKAAFDKLNAQNSYKTGDEYDQNGNPLKDENGKPIRVGHYTQIVWRDTKKVGAAIWTAKFNNRKIVIVFANFDPPGNRTGQKPY